MKLTTFCLFDRSSMKTGIVFLHLIVNVESVRNRNINGMSDKEYDIMIRNITGWCSLCGIVCVV